MSNILQHEAWYSISQASKKVQSSQDNNDREKTEDIIAVTNAFIDNAKVYSSITNIDISNQHLIISFSNGLIFDCGVVSGDYPILRYTSQGIEAKYDREPISAFKLIVPIEDIILTYDKLTEEQKNELKIHFSDLTEQEIVLLQQPALEAATQCEAIINLINKELESIKKTNGLIIEEENTRKESERQRVGDEESRRNAERQRELAETQRGQQEQLRTSEEKSRKDAEKQRELAETLRSQQELSRTSKEESREIAETLREQSEADRKSEYIKVISETNAAKDLALDVANHPNYVGTDFYVYQWNLSTQSYNKSNICLRPEAFNIFRTFSSILEMNDNKDSVPEGKFVVINGDVEIEDTGKLYVRTSIGFDYLVDMSGMRGFTGKTPQFTMGNVITINPDLPASVSLSEVGFDNNGNPIYSINISVPKGKPGTSFKIYATYTTVEELKVSIPNGNDIDGCCAVGDQAPYNYYFWGKDIDGNIGWNNHGKLEGKKGDPYTWEDLTPTQKEMMATNAGNYLVNHMKIDIEGHLIFDTSTSNIEGFGTSLRYTDLSDKPSINGNVLEGNKTSLELGINLEQTQELANNNAKAIDDIQESVSWHSIQ
jgi:hypothetical protein|nr:MAG TPA: protein of unknown function (DUF5401) [Caudoviricetes sp.]